MIARRYRALGLVVAIMLAGCAVGSVGWADYQATYQNDHCKYSVTATGEITNYSAVVVRERNTSVAILDAGESVNGTVKQGSHVSLYRINFKNGNVTRADICDRSRGGEQP